MKTIFETNRWILMFDKSASLQNGNGWKSWTLTLRKVEGNGDDGTRSQYTIGTITRINQPNQR